MIKGRSMIYYCNCNALIYYDGVGFSAALLQLRTKHLATTPALGLPVGHLWRAKFSRGIDKSPDLRRLTQHIMQYNLFPKRGEQPLFPKSKKKSSFSRRHFWQIFSRILGSRVSAGEHLVGVVTVSICHIFWRWMRGERMSQKLEALRYMILSSRSTTNISAEELLDQTEN